MPTTFDLFYLGLAPEIDTVEGNLTSENHQALEGLVFGGSSTPLASDVRTLSPDASSSYTGGSNASSYDSNNTESTEQFIIDGVTLTHDATMVYNGSQITYTDGTTAFVDAIVMQDTNGDLYLLPPPSGPNAYSDALEAKPIESLTLGTANPANGTDTYSMSADRYDLNVQHYVVEGTSGDDLIDVNYTGDPDGDQIDNNDNLEGNNDDYIEAGAGDDTIVGGPGADTINGGGGLDVVDYADSDAGVDVNLDTNSFSGGDATGDTATGLDGIIGSAFNDTLTGFDGELLTGGSDDYTNILDGGAGDDVIDGMAGRDSLYGGVGDDTILGGDGADYIEGDGMSSVFNPAAHPSATSLTTSSFDLVNDSDITVELFWINESGAPVSYGTIAPGETVTQPTFVGHTWYIADANTGAPLQYLGAPADGSTITYAQGNDSIDGGDGDDTILAGGGDDTVDGGTGNDSIDGGAGNDLIDGGTGQDTLFGGAGQDTLVSTGFNDSLDGGADADLFDIDQLDPAGSMNLTIDGGSTGDDNDTLDISGLLADGWTITNLTQNPETAGNPGFSGQIQLSRDGETAVINYNDIENFIMPDFVVDGTSGDDTIDASYTGDPDGDRIDNFDHSDGSNADSVLAGAGDDVVRSGDGDDTVFGEDGSDTIDAGLGNDIVDGGAGDDTFLLSDNFGNDSITGGETGETEGDTLDMSAVTTNTTVDLSGPDPESGTVSDGTSTATFTEIENIILGSGDDTYIGSSGSDTVIAGDGNDSLDGGAGDDSLTGGAGDDRFTFSAGNDTVIGGETGETDGDTLDASAEAEGVSVVFDGNESGTVTQDTTETVTTAPSVFDGTTTIPNAQFEFFVLDKAAWTDPNGMLRDDNNNGLANAGDTITLASYSGQTVGVDGPQIQDAGVVDLVAPVTLNGDSFAAGDDVEMDYGFVVEDGDGIQYFVGKIDIGGGSSGSDWDGSVITAGWDPVAQTWVDPPAEGTEFTLVSVPSGQAPWDGWSGSSNVSTTTLDPYANDVRLGDGIDAPIVQSGPVTTTEPVTHTTTFSEIEDFDLGSGDDTVDGSLTTQGFSVEAGAGDDSLTGGDGDDLLDGGDGTDTIFGGTGDDTILTSGGNDSIEGGDGADVIRATATDPTGVYNFYADGGSGGDDNDTLDISALIADGWVIDSMTQNPETAGNPGFSGQIQLSRGSDPETIWATINYTDIENLILAPSNDLVEGTEDADLIDVDYTGDPEGDRVDAGDNLAGNDDDEILAGGGDDTVFSGAGDDIVYGGAGEDSVIGGTGDDTLSGNSGADTLDGGDGADTLVGGQGGDSIAGGDGGDEILGDGQWLDPLDYASTSSGTASDLTVINSADSTVFLWRIDENGAMQPGVMIEPGDTAVQSTFDDENWILRDGYGNYLELIEGAPNQTVNYGAEGLDDSIDGGGGNDTIYGQYGDDTIDGGLGDDLIYGGSGNDSIDGGAGDDTVFGGDGTDTISGGDGADSIDGGAGDDTIIVDQGDTALGGDGDDTFILQDLDTTGTGNDPITIVGGEGGETNGDTLILTPDVTQSDITFSSEDDAAGGLSGSFTMADGTFVQFSEIENIICFTPGTNILTQHGERPIETLRLGDMVVTRDHGLRPIRWIGKRSVRGHGDFAPVRIGINAMDGARCGLLVSPQHRILFTGYRAELLFGESEVLVPAKHLIDGQEVVQEDHDEVTYIHIMFDSHEVIYADGIATESFHAGDVGLSAICEAAREELFAIFPELRSAPGHHLETARTCLKRHEARLLVHQTGKDTFREL